MTTEHGPCTPDSKKLHGPTYQLISYIRALLPLISSLKVPGYISSFGCKVLVQSRCKAGVSWDAFLNTFSRMKKLNQESTCGQIKWILKPFDIWNPDTLDKILQNGTYVSEHDTDMYVHVNRWMCMYIWRTCTCIYVSVCSMSLHVHEIIYMYVNGTYTFMKCIYMIHSRLYSFTITFHFPSGQISLATQASLNSAQEPLLVSSLLPVICLHRQTTQARLASSKLLQPRVYLIHIAATQAIRCCSVSVALREADHPW